MALFCNNELCRFGDCKKYYHGQKTTSDDYVGDFASTCDRLSQFICDVINNGTWEKVFHERCANENCT